MAENDLDINRKDAGDDHVKRLLPENCSSSVTPPAHCFCTAFYNLYYIKGQQDPIRTKTEKWILWLLLVMSNLLSVLWLFCFVFFFLAALGLRCCARAFCSCGEQGLLFIVVCRLIAVASLVAEHGL